MDDGDVQEVSVGEGRESERAGGTQRGWGDGVG